MMRFPLHGVGRMDGFGGHHLGGVGIAGLILMIILWAVIIAALVLAIRSLVTHSRRSPGDYAPGGRPWGSHPTTPDRADALRILHERYARGEIGRDEYLERRNDLTSNPVEPPTGSSRPVTPPPAPPGEPPATS
jgi:putative membrane protein